MIDEENGTIRRVDWSEICPWLVLFRCFRLAIRFRALVLAAAAVILTLVGWMAFVQVFSSDEKIGSQMKPYQRCPWLVPMDWVPDWTPEAVETSDSMADSTSAFELGQRLSGRDPNNVLSRGGDLLPGQEPFLGSWEQLSRPLRRVFDWDIGVTATLFMLLCGLWALVIWSFFGGAITRSASVELAAGERIGWGDSIRYARSKCGAYFAAPVLPLLGILFCSIFVLIVALLLRSAWTAWLAGLLWPLLLVFGFLMACMLLGLAVGWPLMWATISSEGTDSFDAISRSYAYAFQRPLHYLFYVLVAVVLGVLGWLLVSNFAAGVVYLTYWAASWSAGSDRVAEVAAGGDGRLMDTIGSGIVLFWCDCVKLLAVGFLYSYFWTASTAIYFLLRRDVDATEMDEVFLQEEGEGTYGLPSIETDAAGAPVVTDDQPRETPEEGAENSKPDDGEQEEKDGEG